MTDNADGTGGASGPDGTEAPGGTAAVPQPDKRTLLVAIAALLLSAVALWGSSRLTWLEVPQGATINGQLASDLTGSDLVSWLVRLAVLAVAAVAATLALPGRARQVLGVVLAAAGLLVLWLVLNGSTYEVAWSGPAPGHDAVGEPVRTVWGPVTALAGGLLLLAGGGLLVLRGHRMPRLGAKYSAPGTKPAAQDADDELWRALSDGEDPTSRP